MNTVSTAFGGSIPKNYDKYLGPLLFEFSAKDFAERVGKLVGEKGEVLEVASGTGISTEYLRKSLSKDVSILATDLSYDMLNYARKVRGDLENVTFAQTDALSLPYADNRFDVVACQFGIMFFPDKKKGLDEMMRVVKPGGTVIFNVWDSLENNPIIKLVHDLTPDFFESEPPKFINIPFGYNDIGEITGLMKSVGLEGVDSKVVTATVEGNTPESIARGLITGNPMIVEIEARGTVEPEVVIKKVQEAVEKKFGAQPKLTLQKIVFWGKKPELVKVIKDEPKDEPKQKELIVEDKVDGEMEEGKTNKTTVAFILGLFIGGLLVSVLL